jgi:hypothetical protein
MAGGDWGKDQKSLLTSIEENYKNSYQGDDYYILLIT